MSSLVFDIETNGLLDDTTTIHALVIQDFDTHKVYSCTDNSPDFMPIQEGLKMLEEADLIIGHNILCFDLPVIHKLYPSFQERGTVRDTLTISRLVYPNMIDIDYARSRGPHKDKFFLPVKLYGRHSLESWGYRLSERKGAFCHETDWHNWSPEMQSYCEQDVKVTACLWEHFLQMDYSPVAIELEHQFQKVIFQQERNGFPFNYEAASKLYSDLCAERETLRQNLCSLFPPKDYGDWFTPKVNNKTKGYVKGVQIWRPKVRAFNPGSRDEIAERLIEKYNWKPTDITDSGKPKVDEDILDALPYPEAKQLARFFLLQKRLGQIGEGAQAWLKTAKKETNEDGETIYRIHGRVTTNGAVTGRCTHHDPNLAQVPAVGVPWGEECRSLFYSPKGWSLLGCDASGLELRCLAHYMARYDKGAYAQVILHGDIHWANAQNLGLVPKDMKRDKENEATEYIRNKIAKRFIYAFNYGAGAYKIGTICGVTDAERTKYLADKRAKQVVYRLKERGEKVDDDIVACTLKGTDTRNRFLKTLPALATLIEDVQETAKSRGYLFGLDHRRLPVRSAHSALNTLLQSAGAIAVKKATCLFWDYLKRDGLDDKVKQVAHIHDEFQVLVKQGYEEQVGKLAVQSFKDAGEFFKMRCPLDGEFKYGRNWAETH